MFFTFNQNNSGGIFIEDENVDHYVIIEAKNAKEANCKAECIGIYFDGCAKGEDCWSCGDRWHEVDDGDGTKKPMIYNNTPKEVIEEKFFNPAIIIYYANGKKKKIGPPQERDDDE